MRDWLKSLTALDRKTIGEDIKTVQLGWPLGMPLVRHLGGGFWIKQLFFCKFPESGFGLL